MSKNSSLWSDAIYRLTRNKAAMIGGGILIGLISCALLAPWIAPYSYSYQDLDLGASPPSREHLLGTDILGRDLLSRILYGARVSLLVGFVATGVALVIGVSWGIIAGFFGGRVDSIMMRIVDILYGLPFIIFVILLMVIFGSNLWLLFGAIGAVEWLTMSRIVRGQVIGLKNQEFVLAAKAMGVSNFSMFKRHLLPNILGPIAVYATLTIPQVMLLESFLSFLGLGIQPPMSSWGTLIKDGVESMEGVIVVAATNRPEMIDPALLRSGRFERVLHIPPPDKESIKQILKIHTADMPLGKFNVDDFASRLDNYTGADIEAICRESALIAMRANKKTVSKKFFEQAIDRVRPTVTPEMMEYYGRMEATLTSGLESVKRSNNSTGMESV